MSISKKRSRTGQLLDREQSNKKTAKEISAPESSVPKSAKTSSKWRSRKRHGKEKSKALENTAGEHIGDREWSLSFPCGGEFKSRTLFSKDDKFLLVATEKVIKVYNVQNGHCVRSLGSAGEKFKIVDFVLDPVNEFRVVVVYGNARLRVYDWTDGLLITQFKIKEVPETIHVLNSETLLFCSGSTIRYCSLPFPTSTNKEEIIKLQMQKLLDLGDNGIEASLVAVDPSSSTVCVATGKAIRFGAVQEKGKNLKDKVSWREFLLENEISSLACSADILITGESSGKIHVLFGMQDFLKPNSKPTETVLSWHQSPVTALQISTNGRYILSGGGEETLMISQITSGSRQLVPRLGADITGINQTNSGSLYSISLTNNTIKLINSGDLETSTEISGVISSSTPPQNRKSLSHLSSIALLQPQHSNLYLSGPPTSPSSCTLQSYDLSTDRQSLRFETSLTSHTKHTGKQKRPVIEPRMTSAAFTSDGSWLATIEEWENKYSLEDAMSFEVFLKIWRWREKGWELVAKIENPHGVNGRVLDVTSPVREDFGKGTLEREFVTLGTEGSVKIWRTYKSLHGNVEEMIWNLYRTIGSRNPSSLTKETYGAVKYSPDNSLLVAGIGGYIHLIDTSSGVVVKSLHFGQSICKLEILDRYLLSLHDDFSTFSAWDLASGTILFSERIDRPHSCIAVSHATSTVALATSSAKGTSTITLSTLSLNGKKDETKISIDSAVSHILSIDNDLFQGFIFIDSSGQVGNISKQAFEPNARHGSLMVDSADSAKRSRFISGNVTRREERQMTQTTGGVTLREKEIGQIFQMEGLDIMQMYEKILQNVV